MLLCLSGLFLLVCFVIRVLLLLNNTSWLIDIEMNLNTLLLMSLFSHDHSDD